MHCNPLNILMKLATQIGSIGFAISMSVIFLAYGLAYPSNIGVLLCLNLIINQLVIQIIKRIVNRPRPYKTLDWVIAIKPPACQYSFPSGHTNAAFSLALVLSCAAPAFAGLFVFCAVLVGISRVYLGCHYPTDVVIGFSISYLTFLGIHYLAMYL